ncbi:MAG TPA: S8 family serine peptidase, partial [Arenibaculum sp.]|nr:S8 family serine peptidase [Arenibaculum sp.]
GTYNYFDDHGTHVAGIIGAAMNGTGTMGVAPGVTISNVAVFDDYGWASGITTSSAMGRVVADGARVTNMSYGPTTAGDFAHYETLQAISTYRADTVAVVSAGNSGVKLKNESWSLQSNPLDNLIIVGSVDADKTPSYFSNTPSEACFRTSGSCAEANKFKYRFLMAPGGAYIDSTAANGGYMGMAGTSMAAPHVAGAAALVMSEWTHLTPAETAQILFQSAEDLGQAGVDSVYGWGLLRVDQAFQPIGQQQVATGATVGGGGASAQSTKLVLPAALGTAGAVRNALAGAVVFDDFGRDFKADTQGWTLTRSSAVDLTEHLARSTMVAERGAAFTVPLSGSFNLTSVVPPVARAEEGPGRRFTTDPARADETDGPVWRIDGGFGDMRVSFGQGFAFGEVLDGPRSSAASAPLFLTDAGRADQPLLAFAEGGAFGLSRYVVADGLDVSFGFTETTIEDVTPGMKGDGRAFVTQASFQPARSIDLRLTQTFLDETDMTLGGLSGGALKLGSGARTLATGVSATVEPVPALRVHLHMTEAVTSLDEADGSLFRSVGDLRSRSYGASVTRLGIFGASDELGFNVTRPLRIHTGS